MSSGASWTLGSFTRQGTVMDAHPDRPWAAEDPFNHVGVVVAGHHERRHDVVGAAAPRDQRGPAVDHCVEVGASRGQGTGSPRRSGWTSGGQELDRRVDRPLADDVRR